MPTNAEIMQQISALERRMDGYEKRMEKYEEQAESNAAQLDANSKVLASIKATTDFLKGSFRVIRFAGIAIISAALWQVGTLLFHVITGH